MPFCSGTELTHSFGIALLHQLVAVHRVLVLLLVSTFQAAKSVFGSNLALGTEVAE